MVCYIRSVVVFRFDFNMILQNHGICRRWSHGRCSTSDFVPESEKKDGLQYPYIVCNIGSGVSVLAVRGHNQFERIGGSR